MSDGYCTRPSDYRGSGGMVDYDRWFKGPAALFGGIEYQTPWQPLRFKLEYDSNDYSQDFPVVRAGVDMTPSTPWNVGALYSVGNWGSIRASYQRGNAVAVGITLRTNFNDTKSYWLDEPKPELRPAASEDVGKRIDWDKIAGELSQNAGYDDVAIQRNGSSITIIGKQTKYRDRDEARDRAARVLANHLPQEITSYKIIETNLNLPQTETDVDANVFKQIVTNQPIGRGVTDAIVEGEVNDTKPTSTDYDGFERFDYSFRPTLHNLSVPLKTFIFTKLV